MAVNLPQPLFVPGGGGGGRSTAEQMLMTLLGQLPGLGMQLYSVHQDNQAIKAAQDASLKAMFLEAQAGNPEALGAFATEGLGLSPIAGPELSTLGSEGQIKQSRGADAPATPPLMSELERLSPDSRRALAALTGQLPTLQGLRQGRVAEARAERQEVLSVETHERQMEESTVRIRGNKLMNTIREAEVAQLPQMKRIADFDEEARRWEVEEFNPLRAESARLQAQAARQDMMAQGQSLGMQHWNGLQQNVADLIRAQTSGMMTGDPAARDVAMGITNSIMQGRGAEHFTQLYTDFYDGTPRTAEDRAEFASALAGDTWVTAAINYGYQEDEANTFRDDLEAAGAGETAMFKVYQDRLAQLDTAEQIELNRARSNEEKEQVSNHFESERVGYRFLLNLWRSTHGMKPLQHVLIKTEKEKTSLFETLKQFMPSSENMPTSLLDLSMLQGVVDQANPIQTAVGEATKLGLLPTSVPDTLNLGPFGKIIKNPPGGSLEEIMFGPQGNRR